MEGLLSVSFGTSHADTRARTIDLIDEVLREKFPDRAFYSAWTSSIIVKKVRERGEHHDTLDEAIERLTADGVDDLLVSTTCLMDGMEMSKVTRAVRDWAAQEGRFASLATPLLKASRDRAEVASVIAEEFSFLGDEDALLLMGHGSADADNGVYSSLQRKLFDLGRPRFFIATVEGIPTFEDVLPQIEACGARRVYLAPLMFVAGDHAKNDLAGEDEDSWASLLAARGFDVQPVLKGLGEYAGIRQLVCAHVEDAQTLGEVAQRG